MKRLDLTGQRFGRLLVISFHGHIKLDRAWLCVCDCGNNAVVITECLRSGNNRSCGCLQREASERLARRQHALFVMFGPRHTPRPDGYTAWAGMIQRCTNPRYPRYRDYGGRGIKVHQSFRDFKTFIEAIGPRPAGCQIDRIDNNGNYEPGNVRWATPGGNCNNKNNNRRITYRGETKTITEWARELGVPETRIRYRLNNGWDVEKMMSRRSQKAGR